MSARASQEAEGGPDGGQDPLLWFPQKGTQEAGLAGLGLASLNNFSGLQGISAVSRWLVPGPGVVREGG